MKPTIKCRKCGGEGSRALTPAEMAIVATIDRLGRCTVGQVMREHPDDLACPVTWSNRLARLAVGGAVQRERAGYTWVYSVGGVK